MQYNKETSIGYALTTTLNILRKKFNSDIKKYNITSEQYGVMKLIEKEKLTPTNLANLLNRDKATITRIINSLEKKGLIKKELINKKSFFVKLNKNGKNILQKAEKVAINYHNFIVEKIGEDEIEKMLKTLADIRKILKGKEWKNFYYL